MFSLNSQQKRTSLKKRTCKCGDYSWEIPVLLTTKKKKAPCWVTVTFPADWKTSELFFGGKSKKQTNKNKQCQLAQLKAERGKWSLQRRSLAMSLVCPFASQYWVCVGCWWSAGKVNTSQQCSRSLWRAPALRRSGFWAHVVGSGSEPLKWTHHQSY